MRRWLAFVVVAACGGAKPHLAQEAHVTLWSDGPAPAAGAVWIAGFARNAKAGPIVEVGGTPVTCAEQPPWPAELDGRPVLVAGTLSVRTHEPLPVGPAGERSGGAEGEELLLAGCATPPAAADDGGLLDTERALMAAIGRRDGAALEALVAPELLLRIPGQADVDRAGFLAAVAAIPGEIEAIGGESVIAHRIGDTGIVRGTQVAVLRAGGQTVTYRSRFVDVFARRSGRWVVTVALDVTAAP